MGKRGKESPKRKDGNQDPKDNQQQPDIVPPKQIIVEQPGRRNTASLLKSYSQVLKSSPQVIISWACQLPAIEALQRENTTRKNVEFPKLEKSLTNTHIEGPKLRKPSISKPVECPKFKERSARKSVECPEVKEHSSRKPVDCPKLKNPPTSKPVEFSKVKEPLPIKQSSANKNTKLCKKLPEKAIRLIKRPSKKEEPSCRRKSPRLVLVPKSISCTTSSQRIETSEPIDSSTSVPKNRTRRKALVLALTRVRKPRLSRRCRRSKPQSSSNQPCAVKRTLRIRKECSVTSIKKPLSVAPAKSSAMDKPQEEKEKEEENKINSSNESSQHVEDKDSGNNQTNNESDSDSDDVQMQVLEKQVLSDKEEESDDDSPSLNLPFGSDEDSALLSPSALPASCLFSSVPRRKKRPSTNVEHTAPSPMQTTPFPLPPSTTSQPIASYQSPYKTAFTNRDKFSRYSTASTSFASLPSQCQYPGKRGRGRPRKALEDVKSVSGKLYRKKLERLSAAGVGRGRPIYSPIQTTVIPSTSYDQDRTPYDDNFDDDPMADNTPSPSDQDIGRRMQRWKNRSTFIYAKHKFRNNQDNENGSVKDKFMCKVCEVGFTALSSLKRHYGTIYHKQQEESGQSPGDFLTSPPDRNPFKRDEFQFGRDSLLSTSSSSSTSLGGSRKDLGQRPRSQPRTSSIIRRNAVDNIKKYYAAADAARRRREVVDGVGGGTWIQKQQRRRKPLLHSDYIYQSSLGYLPPNSMMSMDDDSYILGELELGEVRNEDEENNYPMEYEDLIRREEEAQSKTWLSNVWKGVGPPHFTCEFCHESHTNKQEFTRHLFKHRQEEALTCPECKFRLPSEAALESHAKLLCPGGINESRSRFKCNMCTSTFSRLEYFKYHLEIHMRPPVRCPHCPKKFSHKFFLQDHIKAMHEWTNHNGNGNGLSFVGAHGPGSVAETALNSIVVPPSTSPRPKIELVCPGSAAPPSSSTDDRKKINSGGLSQNLPSIPQSPSSTKKRNVSKPSVTKSVSASNVNLLSMSGSHTVDLLDRMDDKAALGGLNEPSSTSNPRPNESVNVNLWDKYFNDEKLDKSEELNNSIPDAGIEMNPNLLADVEQSTTEDGNLVWQFKPSTFDSGLEESRGNIPSLTIEIPRDNIDFGEEVKKKEDSEKITMSSPDYHHQKLSDNAEPAAGKNQQPSGDRQSFALLHNPVTSGSIPNPSNLTLIGCGCKSSVLEKPLVSPLVCQDCGKSFEHRKSLVKHVRYYSQSEDYQCTLCGKSFKLKHHVSRHMKSFHNVDTSSTSGAEDHYDMDALSSPSGSNSGGIMTPTEKESFSSMTTFEGKFSSGTSFPSSSKRGPTLVSKPSPKKIRKRLESSPAIPDPGMSSYSSSTANRKKASSVTSEPESIFSTGTLLPATAVVDSDGFCAFKCLICKNLYPSKAKLNSHMSYHKKKESNMLYKCTQCLAEFKLKHELNIHHHQYHSTDSISVKHTCTQCPAKQYANRKDLLKHMREKHGFFRKPAAAGGDDEGIASTDKIQLSRCPFCNMVFPRERDLKDHMGKEHMRFTACGECGIVLENKQHLKDHMEKEHPRQASEEKEEDEEEDDDDDDDPPTPSPHTSPLHIPNFGREDDEDLEEEQEDEDDPQEDPESEFELLELN